MNKKKARKIVKKLIKKYDFNPIGFTNPRPPKKWFEKMIKKIKKEYDFGKKRLKKIVGGIWWGYPE